MRGAERLVACEPSFTEALFCWRPPLAKVCPAEQTVAHSRPGSKMLPRSGGKGQSCGTDGSLMATGAANSMWTPSSRPVRKCHTNRDHAKLHGRAGQGVELRLRRPVAPVRSQSDLAHIRPGM